MDHVRFDRQERRASVQLVLNGRFLSRPVTGVERVAIELGQALRDLTGTGSVGPLEVLVPQDTDTDDALWPLVTPIGRHAGHRWEQTDLSAARPAAWLLNLCNTGPMWRRRQAVIIHDALFIEHPASFSLAFRWWYRLLLSVLGRRSALVFTVSHFSRTSLERHRLVPHGKAHVLRLGADHMHHIVADDAIVAREGLVPGRYVLAIGSLALHKNLALLVDAFEAAGLDGVALVIAGGGNARVFQSAGLRQADTIRYVGRVTDAQLKALYAHALCFACPSLSEGFGLPPLEAMATGCPVIATTGGAVPEICGDAALYADPHDREAWRDALRAMATDPDLRDDLARRARSRSDRFTWRGAATALLERLALHDGDRKLAAALAYVRKGG